MNEYPNQNQDYGNQYPPYGGPQVPPYHPPYNYNPGGGNQGYERVVTIGEWLRLMLVSLFALIPFIGWIIALIIYIVKATNPELPNSYRNLIKAGFIWTGIVIGFTILLFIIALSLNFSMLARSITGW